MARTRSGRNTAGRGRRPAGRGGRTGRGSAARGGRGGRGGQANAPQRNPLPAGNQDVNMNEPQDNPAQGLAQGDGVPDPYNEMWEWLGVDADGIRYLRDPNLGGFTSLSVLANLPYDGMDDREGGRVFTGRPKSQSWNEATSSCQV